jgi:hypothetical protein
METMRKVRGDAKWEQWNGWEVWDPLMWGGVGTGGLSGNHDNGGKGWNL